MQAFGNPYLRYRPKTYIYILWFFLLDIQLRFSYIEFPLKRVFIKLRYCIMQAIYPFPLKEEPGLKPMERMINTPDHDYGLECDEGLKMCLQNHQK
jgi:hypothetical protein